MRKILLKIRNLFLAAVLTTQGILTMTVLLGILFHYILPPNNIFENFFEMLIKIQTGTTVEFSPNGSDAEDLKEIIK